MIMPLTPMPPVYPEPCQVVIPPELMTPFSRWLFQQGLELFRIPVGGDDLATYGVRDTR